MHEPFRQQPLDFLDDRRLAVARIEEAIDAQRVLAQSFALRIGAERVTADLDATYAYLNGLPAVDRDKIGTIGFCWGGTQSFNYASRQPALNAAIVYYGSATQDADLSKITCPVVGFYGQDDARVTSTVDATRQSMAEKGKSFNAHIYDGAGHGFLRQQRERDGANQKAAGQAWAETIKVLKQHLQ